ncbi:MAG: type II toxin-antitoxin system RelE/ParE family toxin [Planctomycetes bacterium]|nr:type II toxin-antitoxin system RelE/ParE family toxin [Planctomycetota bacterium]
MNLDVSSPAKAQLLKAYNYYENQQVFLGDIFVEDVHSLFGRIAANPFSYREVKDGYHQGLTRKFKYKVIYRVFENEILIVNVWHPAREITF